MRLEFSAVIVLSLTMLTPLILVSGAVAGENMLANPDFEQGTEGWSLRTDGKPLADALIDPNGFNNSDSLFLKIYSAWHLGLHSPKFVVQPGKTYTISFWAKTENDATRELFVRLEQVDPRSGPFEIITVTDKWENHHITVETDATSPSEATVYISFRYTTEDIWFDHFCVYEGSYSREILLSVAQVGNSAATWGRIKSK